VRRLTGAYAVALCVFRLPHLLAFADYDPVRFRPIGVMAALDRPLPDMAWYAALAAAIGLGLAFTAGWRLTATAPTFAAAMLVVTTYRSSWGQIFHTENLLVLHVLVLATAVLAPRLVDPTFAIRLLMVVTVITYVVSGVAKIRDGGWSWLDGETLRNQIAYDNVRKEVLGTASSPIAGAVLRQTWLFPILATSTLVVELGAPAALAGRRWAAAWTASAWAFHIGVAALMAIVFAYPLSGVAFAAFLPVEDLRWPPWVPHRRTGRR
jgi:hypothetical protein